MRRKIRKHPLPAITQEMESLLKASEYAGNQLALFVEFLISLDPRLTRAEATLMAGQVIKNLPHLFTEGTKMMTSLRDGFDTVIAGRQHDHPN